MSTNRSAAGESLEHEGIGAADSAPSLEDVLVPAARVIARLSSPSFSAPLLPSVALEVHALAYKGNADVARIIAALEKDPLLAGRVLKVAQSAAYHAVSGITSLKDAVVRVGLHPLVDILWEVAFTTRVLRAPRYAASIEAVLAHSMACGHLTRLVCQVARVPAEYSFLCGLLHDAGTTAALSVMADPRPGEESPPDALVGPVLRQCHEQATRILAQIWKLPAEVQDVIGHHHATEGELSPLRAALITAEAACVALDPYAGLSELGADVNDPALILRARELLGLNDDQMAALYADGAKVLERLSAERNESQAAATAAAAPRPMGGAPRTTGPVPTASGAREISAPSVTAARAAVSSPSMTAARSVTASRPVVTARLAPVQMERRGPLAWLAKLWRSLFR